MKLLDYKHLLLVDLSSSGLSFYLAKDLKELASIDFSSLTLLKNVFSNDFCQENILADEIALKRSLLVALKVFDLEFFSLVFLLSPESSELEKKTIREISPFFSKTSFVDRHFFYNFYLMQKRNFSKIKFIINLFDDCAELSLFDQEKLLSYEKVLLRNLAFFSQIFFKQSVERFGFAKPDCFYFFSNNLTRQITAADLAKYLKMEVIEIKNLC